MGKFEFKAAVVFQAQALDEILELEKDPDTAGVLKEVINSFCDTAEPMVRELESSLQRDQWDVAERASHSLKSNGRTLGLLRLSEICMHIESEMRRVRKNETQVDSDQASQWVDQVRGEARAGVAALAQFLARYTGR